MAEKPAIRSAADFLPARRTLAALARASRGCQGCELYRNATHRGELLDGEWADWIMATYHPSAVLRAPDEARRHQMRDELIADLKVAARALS